MFDASPMQLGSRGALLAPVDAAPSRPRFEAWLRVRVPEPVEVVWTENRVRLASAARRGGQLVLRLHALFAHGTQTQAHALVALLVGRQRSYAAELALWFRGVRERGAQAQLVAAVPLPVGTTLARAPQAAGVAAAKAAPVRRRCVPAAPLLQQMFDDLNARFFRNGCQASIRWGRAGSSPRRRRRSMQLGCYDFTKREIRLHPALNQADVPAFVVELVVYHEMLHEVFGLTPRGKRRCAHPPEFFACEQAHPDYERARAWEAQHLGRLLAWRA